MAGRVGLGALLLGKRLDEEVMDKIRCCMELLGWWKWHSI